MKIEKRLISSLIKSSSKSVLLLGRRQTGKSTLMHSLEPELVIDLSSESQFLEFHRNPGHLEQLIDAEKPKLVLIDEVQRIPSLLNSVQFLIDRGKRAAPRSGIPHPKFLLTGSSARKLRRGGANLLPGRILMFELGPVVAAELTEPLQVEYAMKWGCLPEPYLTGDARITEPLLKSYAATYLKEEIQAEIQLRTLSGFARFLQVAAENSGRYLDLSKFANQAKVPRQSAVRYFEILEDTLIAYRLGPCSFTPDADLVKHPRYFFFDVGVLNGILREFSIPAERRGVLFEHVVFSQILFTAKALQQDITIENYRTRGGVEVDFTFRWGGKVVAVECKATKDPNEADAKSLHLFSESCPSKSELFLLSFSKRKKKFGKAMACDLNALLEWMKNEVD